MASFLEGGISTPEGRAQAKRALTYEGLMPFKEPTLPRSPDYGREGIGRPVQTQAVQTQAVQPPVQDTSRDASAQDLAMDMSARDLRTGIDAQNSTQPKAAIRPYQSPDIQDRGVVRYDPSVAARYAPAYGEGGIPSEGGGNDRPYSYVDELARKESKGYFDNPAMNERSSPQINYEGGWNDYIKSIAPATAASKSRRIAQEQAGQSQIESQREEGALRRLGISEAGQGQRLGITEQGATGREAMREKGALGLVEREGELRRQAAGEERAFKQPEQEAQIGALGAQSRWHGAQADVAGYTAESAKQMAIADSVLRNPTTHTAQQVTDAKAFIHRKNQDAIDLAVAKAQAMNQTGPYAEDVVHKADGGFIEGYADGGAIGRAQTQQLNPLVSQYGQYLQAAAQTGVSPVPFAQYINLLGSTRGAMQQTPSQFADGGDVSALKRPLEGPGTGRSDSIPALIDGIKPAALSRGEFVLDEETTKYYGTKFLKELQRKAKEALTGGDEGAPANG